jgi:hypothetical protein
MDSFVIPLVPLPPQHLKELGKSEFRLLMGQFYKRLDDLLIAPRIGLIAIDRAFQPYCLTGSALTETVFMPQRVDQLSLLLRP